MCMTPRYVQHHKNPECCTPCAVCLHHVFSLCTCYVKCVCQRAACTLPCDQVTCVKGRKWLCGRPEPTHTQAWPQPTHTYTHTHTLHCVKYLGLCNLVCAFVHGVNTPLGLCNLVSAWRPPTPGIVYGGDARGVPHLLHAASTHPLCVASTHPLCVASTHPCFCASPPPTKSLWSTLYLVCPTSIVCTGGR